MKRIIYLTGISVTICLFAAGAYYCSCMLEMGAFNSQAPSIEDSVNPEAVLSRAKKLRGQSRYAEAAGCLKMALAANRNHAALLAESIRTQLQWAGMTDAEGKRFLDNSHPSIPYVDDRPECVEQAFRYGIKLMECPDADGTALKIAACAGGHLMEWIDAGKIMEAAAERLDNDMECRVRAGQYFTEKGMYLRALKNYLRGTESAPDDTYPWSYAAYACLCLGDYEKALKMAQKAAQAANAGEFAKTATRWRVAQMFVSEEKSWESFGYHSELLSKHRDRGRMDRFHAEAILQVKSIPNEAPPDEETAELATDAYLQLGLTECSRGHYETGMTYFENAIGPCKERHSLLKLTFILDILAQIHKSCAGTFPKGSENWAKNMEEALKLSQESRDIMDSPEYPPHSVDDAGIDFILEKYGRNIGFQVSCMTALYGIQDPRVSAMREKLRTIIPQRVKLPGDESATPILRYEIDALCEEGNWEEALKRFDEIRLTAKDKWYSQHSRHLFDDYCKRADVLFHLGEWDKVLRMGDLAFDYFDYCRDLFDSDRAKQFMTDYKGRAQLASSYAQAAEKLGKIELSARSVEMYKARTLLDLLESRPETRGDFSLLSPDEKEEVRARSSDGLLGGDGGKNGNRYRSLDIENTGFKKLPEDTSSATNAVESSIGSPIPDCAEMVKTIGDAAFVSYVLSDFEIMALVLTKGETHLAVTKFDEKTSIEFAIRALRTVFNANDTTVRDLSIVNEKKEREENGTGEDANTLLYSLLIDPVLPWLGHGLLYICPDGPLNYLPFEALQKDGRFLVEDHPIAYIQSISVLKKCMERERTKKDTLFALGNPNLQNPAFRLANAEDEVRAIAPYFTNAEVLCESGATESAFTARAPSFDVVHIACHAEWNRDEPLLSSLRLAPDDTNDGYLHAGELFNQHLNASLVVLSACNSALGELTSGNELMGLTRSFLYAGAPAIVASLWQVDDRSTAALMERFYANLKTMNKAEALRQAKLDTMKDFPDPFHWAAFCLQGDYR